MSMLEYDVVMCTRDRLAALKLSLPLVLQQSSPPRSIIIVDASSDPGITSEIGTLLSGSTVPWRVVRSPANLPLQRNIGLEYVEAPIVFFPDDDSLYYPDFATEILAAYSCDTEGRVGGVSGKPTSISPLATDNQYEYTMSTVDSIKSKLQPFRRLLEDSLFPKPLDTHAEYIRKRQNASPILSLAQFRPVNSIAGFRMTFRTEAIRATGFDALIGSRMGYAVHEDMNASAAMYNAGYLLIGAQNALVHHYRFPGKRSSGFEYGFFHIFNYIYMCKKHIPLHSPSWNNFDRYFHYKLFLYRLTPNSEYYQTLRRGSRTAWQMRHRLLEATDLDHSYAEVISSIFGDEKVTSLE